MLGVIDSIPVGGWPTGITVSADGAHLYVNDFNGPTKVFDAKTAAVTETLPTGPSHGDPVVLPDGSRAYLAEAHAVAVVDLAANSVKTRIPVTDLTAPAMAANANGSRIYATYGRLAGTLVDVQLMVIDTVTDTAIANIPIAGASWSLAVSPDGNRVYVPNFGQNTITVIDTVALAVIGYISVDGPMSVAVHPNGRDLYVGRGTGTNAVVVVDTVTRLITATIPVPAVPVDIALSLNGSHLYASCSTGEVVAVIDTTSRTLSYTVALTDFPSYVAVSPDNSRVYVTKGVNDSAAVVVLGDSLADRLRRLLPDLYFDHTVFGPAGSIWVVVGKRFYPVPPRPPLEISHLLASIAPMLGEPIDDAELAIHLRNQLHGGGQSD